MANNIIKGRKGGGSKQRTPTEQPDDLQSVAKAKILLALGEGEFAGGLTGKDIYLDGTRLKMLMVRKTSVACPEFRPGTQAQTYIQGIPGTENEISVGTEVSSKTAWTHTFTNTQLSAVRVRLKWPSLMKQEDDGDVVGNTVKYAIDLQTDGGAWQTVLETAVTGKTTSGYERSHRIDLPRPAVPGRYACVKSLRMQTVSKLATMTLQSYTEVIDAKLRYPNTALLYIEFDSSQFNGSIPQISCEPRGRVIRVPDNYNPETREYTGVWTGGFKWAWTDNPAWIYYDIVTADRFGLGNRLSSANISKWTLYQIAQYCDQLVPDGRGGDGMEPRYTCNVYVQERNDAYTVLRDFAAIFRGMTCWNGEQIVVQADMPRDVDFTYTRANIVGKPRYSSSSSQVRYTNALVSWSDPDNAYADAMEPAFIPELVSRYSFNQLELTAIGCTRQSEAHRKGLWGILTNNKDRVVEFDVGLDGRIPQPGYIIALADELLAGRVNGGRISAVNGRVITLDRDVDAKPGDRLQLNLPSGISQSRTIQAVNGRRQITVTTAYSETPERECVWAVESNDLFLQQYRVTGMTRINSPASIPARLSISARLAYCRRATSHLLTILSSHPARSIRGSASKRRLTGQRSAALLPTRRSGAVTTGTGLMCRAARPPRLRSAAFMPVVTWFASVRSMRRRSRAAGRIPKKTLTGKVGEPLAPLALATRSLVHGVQVWEFPTGSGDTLRTELQYSKNQDGSAPMPLSDAYPGKSYQQMGLSMGAEFWYRARLVDRLGKSPWTGWVQGPAITLMTTTKTPTRSRIRMPGRKRSVPLAKRRKVSAIRSRNWSRPLKSCVRKPQIRRSKSARILMHLRKASLLMLTGRSPPNHHGSLSILVWLRQTKAFRRQNPPSQMRTSRSQLRRKQETADRIADVNAKAAQAADELLAATQGLRRVSRACLRPPLVTKIWHARSHRLPLAQGAVLSGNLVFRQGCRRLDGRRQRLHAKRHQRWLASQQFDFNLSIPRIKKVGSPTWNAKMFWIGADETGWNAGRSVVISEPEYDDKGIAILTLHDIEWRDSTTIRRFRFDFTTGQDADNYLLFDWIAVGRPAPGASTAALQDVRSTLSNALTAEAQARSTLAAQMRGSYEGSDLDKVTSGLLYQEKPRALPPSRRKLRPESPCRRSLTTTKLLFLDVLRQSRARRRAVSVAWKPASGKSRCGRADVPDAESGTTNAALAKKAEAAAVTALTQQVEQNGRDIRSNTDSITSLSNQLVSQPNRWSRRLYPVQLANAGTVPSFSDVRAVAPTVVDEVADAAKLDFTSAGSYLALYSCQVKVAADTTITLAPGAGFLMIPAPYLMGFRSPGVTPAGIPSVLNKQAGTPLSFWYSGLGVSALANAAGVLSSNVSQIGNEVVSNSQSITQLRNALTQTDANVASKADQTAMNSLTGRVEKTESGLTAANANITSLKSAVRAGNASGGDLIPNPTFDPAYDQMGFSVVATTAEEVPPGCPYGYAARIASRDHHPNFAAFPATLNDVIEISALVACGAGTANFNLYVGTAVRPDTSTGAPLMAGAGNHLPRPGREPPGASRSRRRWWTGAISARSCRSRRTARMAPYGSLRTGICEMQRRKGSGYCGCHGGGGLPDHHRDTTGQDSNTVTQLGNDPAANSAITKLTGNLANTDKALAQKADATALATLDTKVTQQGKTLESQSNSLTNLSNSLSQIAADIDASGQIPGNLVVNPSFERGLAGYTGQSSATSVVELSVPHSGTRALKVDPGNVTPGQLIPFVQGRTYEIGVWVKEPGATTDNGAGNNKLRIGNSAGQPVLSVRTTAVRWGQTGPFPVAGKRQRQAVYQRDIDATAGAVTGLTSRVSTAEGTITSQSQQLTNLQNSLNTTNSNVSKKADATALTSVDNRVTEAEGKLTTQSQQLTNLANVLTATRNAGDNLIPNFDFLQGSTAWIFSIQPVPLATSETGKQGSGTGRLTPVRGSSPTTTSRPAQVPGGGEGQRYFRRESADPSPEQNRPDGQYVGRTSNFILIRQTVKSGSIPSGCLISPMKPTSRQPAMLFRLPGRAKKADASAVSSLTNRVTQTEKDIRSQADSLTSLNTSLKQQATRGANVLPDGSFESYAVGDVLSNARAVITSEAAHSGTKSLRVTRSTEYNPNATDNNDTHIFSGMQVRDNAVYYVEAWVKLPAGSTADPTVYMVLGFSFQDSANGWSWPGLNVKVSELSVDNWTKVSGYLTNNRTALKQAMVRISIPNTPKVRLGDAFLIDDLIITDVTDAKAALDAADANAQALSSLSASVTQNGQNITSQGSAITKLQSDVTQLGKDISGKADASALTNLTTRVTATEGSLKSQGTAPTRIAAKKADATALQSLQNTVEQQGKDLTAQSNALTNLQNSLSITNGNVAKKADSAAVSMLSDRVSASEGMLTSQGNLPFGDWLWIYVQRCTNVSTDTVGVIADLSDPVNWLSSTTKWLSGVTTDWQTKTFTLNIPATFIGNYVYLRLAAGTLTPSTARLLIRNVTLFSSNGVSQKASAQSVSDLTNRVTSAEGKITSRAGYHEAAGRFEQHYRGQHQSGSDGSRADWPGGKTEAGLTAANSNISLTAAVTAGKAAGDYIPNPSLDPAYDRMGYDVVETTAAGVPADCPFTYAIRLAGRDHVPKINNIAAPGDVFEMSALACGAGSADFNFYIGRATTATGIKARTSGAIRPPLRGSVPPALYGAGGHELPATVPAGRNVTAANSAQKTADATAKRWIHPPRLASRAIRSAASARGPPRWRTASGRQTIRVKRRTQQRAAAGHASRQPTARNKKRTQARTPCRTRSRSRAKHSVRRGILRNPGNLIVNGSFERGAAGFTGWSSTATVADLQVPHSGNKAQMSAGQSNLVGQEISITQVVPTAGASFQLTTFLSAGAMYFDDFHVLDVTDEKDIAANAGAISQMNTRVTAAEGAITTRRSSRNSAAIWPSRMRRSVRRLSKALSPGPPGRLPRVNWIRSRSSSPVCRTAENTITSQSQSITSLTSTINTIRTQGANPWVDGTFESYSDGRCWAGTAQPLWWRLRNSPAVRASDGMRTTAATVINSLAPGSQSVRTRSSGLSSGP
ncbi:tail tip host specificity protein J [Klebsiella phage Kpn74]|uniref:Tail tip host specificity protein J n=1 Tax=Klebsiella phage Kpn74 TaxID=3044026 RepID=A0AAT9V515_9CAUD|nr:tail tip host specificity protein J [Klebsiella phage Kpn74]